MRLIIIAAIGLLSAPTLADSQTELQQFLEATVVAAREGQHIPAIAALVQVSGVIEAETAIGVRAVGHSQPVTIHDRWHIGSDTKAFTSTMIARLVEQRVMRFEDTLAECFPGLAKEMDPAYRGVTVLQLLSHTAGLPPLTDDGDLPAFMALLATADGVQAQRATVVREYLSQPPASKVGEFNYSNLGYVIAGAIAEARTGKSWEELIRAQVFAPLGITNAGFGAPGSPGRFDQPRGHRDLAGTLVPLDPQGDLAVNPPALGPAGTINIALRDWVLFAQDQIDGVHGRGRLLQPETYRRLHTPVTGPYALGWGAKLDEDGRLLLLTHSGSNGYWLADIRIIPLHDIVIVVAMNAGTEAAENAMREIRRQLIDRLKPFE